MLTSVSAGISAEIGGPALGVVSSLVNQKLLDAGDMAELTHRAAGFIEEVQKGRKG